MPFFYAKKNYFHFPPSSYPYQPYPLRVITIKLTCQLLAAASSITCGRESITCFILSFGVIYL